MTTDPASQFQAVAMWVGLISGIVSIVLSLVAIAFAVLVNNRATDVNDQTIQALNKIEADVEHLSEDTRELIKAGWDKMLGSVDRLSPMTPDALPAKEIASGIAAELRAELAPLVNQSSANSKHPAQLQEKLDRLAQAIEGALAAQSKAQSAAQRPGEALEWLVSTLSALSPEAQALVRLIRFYHMAPKQYETLRAGPLGSAIDELRKVGLIVPVEHKAGGKRVPCYYFPTGLSALVRAAIPVLPKPPEALTRVVKEELDRIGYQYEPPEERQHGQRHD